MNKELTIIDIQKEVDLLRSKPHKLRYVENEHCICGYSDLGMETIKLKPIGKKLIDEFIRETNPKNKDRKIKTIFGIEVVVSNDVESWELK